MSVPYLTRHERSLTLAVRVSPNARRSGVEGIWNGTHLKIALSAPPVEGKANEALIAFLSDLLSVRKSALTLISGQTGRVKKIAVQFAESSAAVAAEKMLAELV